MGRAAVVMACAVMLSVSTGYAGVFQTITLDGDLSEWGDDTLFYSNAEIADASNADAGYNSVYIANDAENLYIGIRTDGAGGGSISNDWGHNFYLDTDTQGTTGINNGWMTHGYDFLVQYGTGGTTYSIYAFAGATQGEWTWNFLSTFNYSYGGDVIEWSIPLALLGQPEALVAEFNVNGGSAGGETWASSPESDAKTYTLAVPEPGSLGLVALGSVLLGLRRRNS